MIALQLAIVILPRGGAIVKQIHSKLRIDGYIFGGENGSTDRVSGIEEPAAAFKDPSNSVENCAIVLQTSISECPSA
jgi:hypothetical protein